ncbi:type II secretion system F family protein [Aquabacterium humicola]|uniref:type II secretion system F family protein n=1 Tax=Aquabacterium humicola TaxID=3237377 RepID=UPI002542B9B1|nr:type II secretion system F family protein [Rubrivivax pictus]
MTTLLLEASGAEEAQRSLVNQGMRVVSLSPAGRGTPWSAANARRFAVLLFAQEMLALLEAGLSVIASIEALLEKGEPHSRAVLERIANDLRSGHKFSVALQQQADVFPPLFVAMIGAAERTSNLPEALIRYIEYQTRTDAVRARVISASVYPAILLLVGGAVTMFLLAYVVPKFAGVYQGTGRSLPWASQLLLDWGRLAAAHGPWMAVAGAVAAVMLVQSVFRLRRGGGLGAWASRLPWIGERVRQVTLARLYLTLGVLLEGGMSINQALQILQSVGLVDGARIERLRLMVSEGQALSVALEHEQLTMPVVLRLLRVGEQTGQLGAMLRRAALFHEGETARWIERFTRAFEPALMAVIGVVIGAIVLLLYMPIFDLASSFQ